MPSSITPLVTRRSRSPGRRNEEYVSCLPPKRHFSFCNELILQKITASTSFARIHRAKYVAGAIISVEAQVVSHFPGLSWSSIYFFGSSNPLNYVLYLFYIVSRWILIAQTRVSTKILARFDHNQRRKQPAVGKCAIPKPK